MAHLIDKSALVAEITRRIKEHNSLANAAADNNLHNTLEANELLIRSYKNLMSFLSTLEVKEVDLEKELENLIEKEKAFVTDNREVKYYNGDSFNRIYELEFIAKHFFELGLKAKEAGYSKPANEDLEEAAKKYADEEEYGDDVYYSIKATFKEGANWQKEQFEKKPPCCL